MSEDVSTGPEVLRDGLAGGSVGVGPLLDVVPGMWEGDCTHDPQAPLAELFGDEVEAYIQQCVEEDGLRVCGGGVVDAFRWEWRVEQELLSEDQPGSTMPTERGVAGVGRDDGPGGEGGPCRSRYFNHGRQPNGRWDLGGGPALFPRVRPYSGPPPGLAAATTWPRGLGTAEDPVVVGGDGTWKVEKVPRGGLRNRANLRVGPGRYWVAG